MITTILNLALWVFSITAYVIYNLYRKNIKLEKIIDSQFNTIAEIRNVILESNKLLQDFDARGIYKSDDETGTFFKLLLRIQNTLNQFFKNE